MLRGCSPHLTTFRKSPHAGTSSNLPPPRPAGRARIDATCPSGVWDVTEYEKLPRYDRDTGEQPTAVFQRHLTDKDTRPAQHRLPGTADNGGAGICAGWAGCHDGDNLLSLRIAVHCGLINPETKRRTITYVSPVPLWESGAAAAVHDVGAILNPPEKARRIIDKLVLVYGKTGTTITTVESATSTPNTSRRSGAPNRET